MFITPISWGVQNVDASFVMYIAILYHALLNADGI